MTRSQFSAASSGVRSSHRHGGVGFSCRHNPWLVNSTLFTPKRRTCCLPASKQVAGYGTARQMISAVRRMGCVERARCHRSAKSAYTGSVALLLQHGNTRAAWSVWSRLHGHKCITYIGLQAYSVVYVSGFQVLAPYNRVAGLGTRCSAWNIGSLHTM